MDTAAEPFPRRSEMSTLAVTPGLSVPRRRPVARPAATAPVAGAASSVGAAPVRLTRRGRLVLTLLFLVALTVVLAVFGATSAATGEAGEPVPTRAVVVQPGDTLWGIAAEVAEPGEVREMVHRIQELNAMAGSGVAIGEELAVPLG
jgi:nucleoid-associated protein YgaU